MSRLKTTAISSLSSENRTFGPTPFQRRTQQVVYGYCGLCISTTVLFFGIEVPAIQAFLLGMIVPGAGFLHWAEWDNPLLFTALSASALAMTMFVVSCAIWFGTGNIVLPPVIWLISAIIAGLAQSLFWARGAEPGGQFSSAVLVLACATSALIAAIQINASTRKRKSSHTSLNLPKATGSRGLVTAVERKHSSHCELSESDLQRMRLLLDRALQPVDEFNGFEWADQFQTAAVRYQLNFLSYALSIAQSVHLPAFDGYLKTAQENLATKQQNYRIWRYWRLENAWGKLRLGADPIPRDNIMFTGFVAAQLAYFHSACGGTTYNEPGCLKFQTPGGGSFSYSLPDLIDILSQQYKDAKFGLLACEPNWIYPLCNTITASAIRTFDTQNDTQFWSEIEPGFRHQLEAEFVRADGRLVPFRSSYTGLAVPPIGGAVIQSFPCLFLNTIMPDIAERQWTRFRERLEKQNWKQAFWPIDIGNYRFSRAASYAATAAAAVEMGDPDLANSLLGRLDEECPLNVSDGVAHRENASLWAHAVELIARGGASGAFQTMASNKRIAQQRKPFVKEARYPDVLVAQAIHNTEQLCVVLYPGKEAGFKALVLGGLKPFTDYQLELNGRSYFRADENGEARLNIPVHGRTAFCIHQSD
ncbi:MAG: hypothetical protein ABJN26_07685 [Stappiaceae bacterium]